MKRLKKISLALIAAVLLMLPGAAYPWEVKITNKTKSVITTGITYLGWWLKSEATCWSAQIQIDDTRVCGIPAPHCATSIMWGRGISMKNQTGVGSDLWGSTCWNVWVTMNEDDDGNITFSRQSY